MLALYVQVWQDPRPLHVKTVASAVFDWMAGTYELEMDNLARWL
jgi:hypothetical protein